jgi:CRP-like cAMP-binding protein
MSQVDFLKKVPLLADLSTADLDRLLQMGQVVQLAAGEDLFSEGSPGDRAYIIKEGQIEIVKSTSAGPMVLAVRQSGEMIGEMALLHQGSRMASARAHTASTLLALSQEHFNRLLEQSHSATRVILKNLAPRWQETEELLNRLRAKESVYLRQVQNEKQRSDDLLHVVIPLGASLAAEQNFDRLLEKIVQGGMSYCHADAGTLYLRTPDDHLAFVIVQNNSLRLTMGGTSGQAIAFAPLPLYTTQHQSNYQNVATYAALTGTSVNIVDAYQVETFDFSGAVAFDAKTGYRSQSFLTVPLKNNVGRVVGVLQLINAQDPETKQVGSFDQNMQQVIESLAILATVALEAYIREQKLRQEIQQLRIEIDKTRQTHQVSQITGTDYFKQLRSKADSLRSMLQEIDENRPPEKFSPGLGD